MSTRRKWTTQEVNILIGMVQDRETSGDIGLELGRSIRSVQVKIDRLRIGNGRNGKPLDLVRASVILDWLLMNKSIVVISKLMKKSYNSIRYTVHRLVKRGLAEKVGTRYRVTYKWSDNRKNQYSE